MPHPAPHPDPLHALGQQTRRLAILLSCALFAAILWAIWPRLAPASSPSSEQTQADPSPSTTKTTPPPAIALDLDPSLFAAPIWRIPVVAEVIAPPVPPPPPLRLQLLAINTPAGDPPSAIIIDLERDTTEFLVPDGEYRGFKVASITRQRVELTSGEKKIVLGLDTAPAGAGGNRE